MKETRINRSKTLRSSRAWKTGVVLTLVFSIILSLLSGLGFLWMANEDYYRFSGLSEPYDFSIKLEEVPFEETATPSHIIRDTRDYLTNNLVAVKKGNIDSLNGTLLCELDANGETIALYLSEHFNDAYLENVYLSLSTPDGKKVYWNTPEEPKNGTDAKLLIGFAEEGKVCLDLTYGTDTDTPFQYQDFDYIFITREELLEYAAKNCLHMVRYEHVPGLDRETLGLTEESEQPETSEEPASPTDTTVANVTTTATTVTTAADGMNPTHATTMTTAPASSQVIVPTPEIFENDASYYDAQHLFSEEAAEHVDMSFDEYPYTPISYINNAAVLILDYTENQNIKFVYAMDALADYAWAVRKSNYYNYDYDQEHGIYYISLLTEETVEPVTYLECKAVLVDEENFSNDMRWTKTLYDKLYPLRIAVIVIGALAVIAALVSFILMLRFAGWKKGYDTPQLRAVDKIPLEISLGAYILAGAILYEPLDYGGAFWVLAMAALAVPVLMTIIRRIKTRTLFKNTLCVKGFRVAKKLFAVLPSIWQVVLIGAAYGIFSLICVFAMHGGYIENGFMFILWGIVSLALFGLVILFCSQLGGIVKTAQKIADGSSEEKVTAEMLLPPLGRHAESINSIGDSVSAAVEDRLRSERMKTDLIANVSHDIKTPLTSVINYIDLLGRTDITDPTAQEYLFVLERQATRLKRLLEDIVDASKASSGCINAELRPLNLRELLDQSIAEYSDKLLASGITPVVNVSEDCAAVLADGRLLWRVFDNLLSNICKYSQSGTRTYIEAVRMGDCAEISFRSISAEQLNISAETLMERFVRGDRSRHTEGSGLGLSIARSLVELQNGQLNLSIDGDLFRAAVILPLCELPEEPSAEQHADIPEQPTLTELAAQCERFAELEASDSAKQPELAADNSPEIPELPEHQPIPEDEWIILPSLDE